MVQQATLNDVPTILAFARKFHAASPYRVVEFDTQAVTELLAGIITRGVIFYNDHGFLAGILSPIPFSPANVIATELSWYCPNGDGQELKDAFEDWGVDNGCHAFQFSVFNDKAGPTLGRRLEEDGYQIIEAAYIKSSL